MKYSRILAGIIAVIVFPALAAAQCTFVKDEAKHAAAVQQTAKLTARSLRRQHAFKVPKDYRIIPIYKVSADHLKKSDFAGGQLPGNLRYTYQQVPGTAITYLQQDGLLVDGTGALLGYVQGYTVFGLESLSNSRQQGLRKLAADVKEHHVSCLCTILNLKPFNIFRISGGEVTVSEQPESTTVYSLQEFLDKRWNFAASL